MYSVATLPHSDAIRTELEDRAALDCSPILFGLWCLSRLARGG
jgi:hypothetical protein